METYKMRWTKEQHQGFQRSCLTSLNRREAVLSWLYGRSWQWHRCHYIWNTVLLTTIHSNSHFRLTLPPNSLLCTVNNYRHISLTKKGAFPKRWAVIVWQDDLLLSNLTVRENIAFAAKLKTPRWERRRAPSMVDEVLHDLWLDQCSAFADWP